MLLYFTKPGDFLHVILYLALPTLRLVSLPVLVYHTTPGVRKHGGRDSVADFNC